MKVALFGASGMLGSGVLRECLADGRITQVVSVGRSALPVEHAKLLQIRHGDFLDFAPLADELASCDACFWCLGVSSVGMKDAEYRRITYDVTMAAASVFDPERPGFTFCFVSGAGTDAGSRTMWRRVKGEAEEALRRRFPRVYLMRPGFVQPLDGTRSRTRLYRVLYGAVGFGYPLWRRLAPSSITDTRALGRAMVALAVAGGPSRVLTNRDINVLGRPAPGSVAVNP